MLLPGGWGITPQGQAAAAGLPRAHSASSKDAQPVPRARLREEVAHELLVAADLLALQAGRTACSCQCASSSRGHRRLRSARPSRSAAAHPAQTHSITQYQLPPLLPPGRPTCRYTSCWERATPMNSAGMTRPCGSRSRKQRSHATVGPGGRAATAHAAACAGHEHNETPSCSCSAPLSNAPGGSAGRTSAGRWCPARQSRSRLRAGRGMPVQHNAE